MSHPKSITIPPEVSPLRTEQVLIRHHFSLLTPDRPSPCSIYTYFKGRYLEIIKRDARVPIEVIAKMLSDQNYFFYISKKEEHLFEFYLKERHSFQSIEKYDLNEDMKIKDHRVSQYIGLAEEFYQLKDDNVTSRMLLNDGVSELRKTCQNGALNWYFENEWNKDVITHTSTVAFLVNLFLECAPQYKERVNRFYLNFAMVIHHLEVSPKSNLEHYAKPVFDYLTEHNIPIIEPISKLIQYQDETFDGNGKEGLKGDELPLESQIFSIFDRFDHIQVAQRNLTRKKTFEASLSKLRQESDRFSPEVMGDVIGFFKLVSVG